MVRCSVGWGEGRRMVLEGEDLDSGLHLADSRK